MKTHVSRVSIKHRIYVGGDDGRDLRDDDASWRFVAILAAAGAVLKMIAPMEIHSAGCIRGER